MKFQTFQGGMPQKIPNQTETERNGTGQSWAGGAHNGRNPR